MEKLRGAWEPPTSIHNFVNSATEWMPSLVVMAVRWSLTVRTVGANFVEMHNMREIPAYNKVALRYRGDCDMQQYLRPLP